MDFFLSALFFALGALPFVIVYSLAILFGLGLAFQLFIDNLIQVFINCLGCPNY